MTISQLFPPGPDRSWMDDAACKGVPTYIFFPFEGAHVDGSQAARICASCRVKDECLDYAIRNREVGIWAGTNEVERQRIRRRKSRQRLRDGAA